MGLFDFLGGGTPAEKAQKLKGKATQKFGDAATRQKALFQLGELASPDAVAVLMQRFTFNVEPQTTDRDEKDAAFHSICDLKRHAEATGALLKVSKRGEDVCAEVDAAGLSAGDELLLVGPPEAGSTRREVLGAATVRELKGAVAVLETEGGALPEPLFAVRDVDQHRVLTHDAVPAVVDFLMRNDSASSWALKILDAVLPEPEVTGIVTAELTRLGAEYTRDPEKKEVLLHHLLSKADQRIGPAVLPFLRDMSDDVKMAAVKTVASVKYEPAREALLSLLTGEDVAKRVQTACIQALADTGFPVQGYREKVEARLVDPFFVDRSGVVKRRGE